MANDTFDKNLADPEKATNEKIVNEIEVDNEKEYMDKVRAKNIKHLIKLDYLERERIARHIKELYDEVKTKQREISDDIDEWDEVYRMKRMSIPGDDGESPNYRSPLSTVTLEVIHANSMNVFFTPKDTMKIIPTEAGDIPKIKKLDIFGNWSMKNEMELFENCDRLFHSSAKNGECPYMVHWVKEYGTEIKREIVTNPANPNEPMIDKTTGEPIIQETEIQKILYNGPKLEIFSRKDYILPENAIADKIPDWEMRRKRYSADKARRNELEGRFYKGTFKEMQGWEDSNVPEDEKIDKDAEDIPMGKGEKMFVEFYGKLRVQSIKTDKNGDEFYEELEDEFIATVELISETLCSLKKNKFPLKMRPTGMDTFIPDDEGRLEGTGVMEFMDGPQKMYDLLTNQHLHGTIQSNNPFGFFTPTGNMRDEPIKVKAGYLYPTSDPKSINIVKLPAPDSSLREMMEEARNWSQVLFGISDYAAGVESQIDPSAPAKKAELVVAQGNVRLNLIIKRKNRTLQDIFKRWFLLYQVNMPPNKFMRIAGEDADNPWKFEPINMSDFSLKSIPDFELTGNVLNSNKALEAQKAISIYQLMMQNPFFAPMSQEGQQALFAITKWLLDKMDETGISNFLPKTSKDRVILTPEEENARFMQGDKIEPKEGEDHVYHVKTHSKMMVSQTIPDSIKKNVFEHIQKTTELLKKQVTQQIVMSQTRQNQPQGGMNGQAGPQGAPAANQGLPPAGPSMAGSQAGATANI